MKNHRIKIFNFQFSIFNFFIAFLLLFFCFSSVHAAAYLDTAENLVFKVFSPFLEAFNWIGDRVNDFLRMITSLKDLVRDNFTLKKENERLLAENAIVKELKEENGLFRRLMGFAESQKIKFIEADVVGKDPQNMGNFILINKGNKDGIKVGAAVTTADGALVGAIAESSDSFSKILLENDPNILINAVIENENRSQGIVKGDHGLALLMDMLPLNDKIEKDQLVVTAQKNDLFPKGIAIGKIDQVFFKENEVFQKAIVKPAADLERLEKVFVVK